MLESRRFSRLRVWVMLMLALLVLQYESGIAFNISDPPHLAPFSATSFTAFNNALMTVGPAAIIHVILGTLLGIVAIITQVLALRTSRRSVKAFGGLTLLAIIIAGIMGQLFAQSGYQNDGYSHGMATTFILSFILAFLELYFLKPAPKEQAG